MDHDLDLYESLDIHRHATIRYSMCYFLYTCSIVTESVSPAVCRDIEPKRIGVTTFTFQGYVMSSIM